MRFPDDPHPFSKSISTRRFSSVSLCAHEDHHHQAQHDTGLHEHRELVLVEVSQEFGQFVPA